MELQEVIYQHYINQENHRLVSIDRCKEIEIEQSDLDEAILDTKKRLEVKLKNGDCSQFLIEQISRHRLNIGEKFCNKIEFYIASEILDIIELLENDKIGYDNFNRNILIGFSKVHHSTYSGIGYSIARNIKEYWFKKGKIRSERLSEYESIVAEYEKHGISAVVNMMHSRAMSNKDLKGEWIIFKQLRDKKYYLCLASHLEQDETIFESKLKKCLIEFPELI